MPFEPPPMTSEFDKSDGDSRLHSDYDCSRIENPGHGGDIAQHPSDERIDNFETGYVDEYTPLLLSG